MHVEVDTRFDRWIRELEEVRIKIKHKDEFRLCRRCHYLHAEPYEDFDGIERYLYKCAASTPLDCPYVREEVLHV